MFVRNFFDFSNSIKSASRDCTKTAENTDVTQACVRHKAQEARHKRQDAVRANEHHHWCAKSRPFMLNIESARYCIPCVCVWRRQHGVEVFFRKESTRHGRRITLDIPFMHPCKRQGDCCCHYYIKWQGRISIYSNTSLPLYNAQARGRPGAHRALRKTTHQWLKRAQTNRGFFFTIFIILPSTILLQVSLSPIILYDLITSWEKKTVTVIGHLRLLLNLQPISNWFTFVGFLRFNHPIKGEPQALRRLLLF